MHLNQLNLPLTIQDLEQELEMSEATLEELLRDSATAFTIKAVNQHINWLNRRVEQELAKYERPALELLAKVSQ